MVHLLHFLLTFTITASLVVYNNYGIEEAFRKSLFQVASIHTSCGFGTDDYSFWPPFTWVLLIFAMMAGGCTGSTAGGIKNLRLMIMAKGIRNHFKNYCIPMPSSQYESTNKPPHQVQS